MSPQDKSVELARLQQLLTVTSEHVYQLELQKAHFGSKSEPHIITGINEGRIEIATLEQKIQALQLASELDSTDLVQIVQQSYAAAGAPYGDNVAALVRWVKERLPGENKPHNVQPSVILIVDGDTTALPLIKQNVESILQDFKLTHTIQAANNSSEAIACIQGDDVALVITEYFLPSLGNGLQLVHAITARSPKTKTLIITSPRPEVQQAWELEIVDYYLPKPYTKEQLAAIMRRVLF